MMMMMMPPRSNPRSRRPRLNGQTAAGGKACCLQLEANDELDPDRKRRILAMAEKFRVEASTPREDEIDDEEKAQRIAYIHPVRDAIFRWAEEQSNAYGLVQLDSHSDGSACIDLWLNTHGGSGLRVRINLTLADI